MRFCVALLQFTIASVFVLQVDRAASVVVPRSKCYAFDNSSHIVDFSSWIGHPFEYNGTGSPDVVVRFCKDVETRSQKGFVGFGRFGTPDYFVAGSGRADFVQGFYGGDLLDCEKSHDKLGRTAQVNILCGSCLNGQCKGGLGCICKVTYESNCRVFVELAIPCEKPGPRVFQGFTVGFHPRTWEIVYNGMTQIGFERSYRDFSFQTEQTRVSLYMTAVASLSTLIRKPIYNVLPKKGLEISLSGSGATGNPPTTLSPTMLLVDWRCEIARDTPYEVDITIPVEGYEPIHFMLTKMCEYRQDQGGQTSRGWATFGVISCIFIISSTLFCCGGFIYKTKVQSQRGIDALPGMTLITACLETIDASTKEIIFENVVVMISFMFVFVNWELVLIWGSCFQLPRLIIRLGIGDTGRRYSRPEDLNSAFSSEASWERPPTTSQRRPADRNYGAIASG